MNTKLMYVATTPIELNDTTKSSFESMHETLQARGSKTLPDAPFNMTMPRNRFQIIQESMRLLVEVNSYPATASNEY